MSQTRKIKKSIKNKNHTRAMKQAGCMLINILQNYPDLRDSILDAADNVDSDFARELRGLVGSP